MWRQPLRAAVKPDHYVIASRPNGLDQSSAEGQLLFQRRRDLRERCGDEDRIEERVCRQSLGSVPHNDRDVGDALTG